MEICRNLSRYMARLALLVGVITLTACGGGFSDKTAQSRTVQSRAAADAYLVGSSAANKANAPTTTATLSTAASITSGLYTPQVVELTCTGANGNACLATYYTIDGTTPGRASTPYTGPITIRSKTTVKYFSVDVAGNIEPVKTQNFLIGSIDITDIKTVAAGLNHTIGLKNDGTLWAWGGNASGQLGIGTLVDQTKPVQIGAGANWSAISAGNLFTLALKNDGTLWSWGANGSGQLGDGTLVDKSAPVQVGAGTTWSAIATGNSFALALKSDGTIWAWGLNNKGQVGDGTNVDKSAPVQVGGGTAWTAIAAGYDHAVALRNDGTLWAWGGNSSGQLGQNTIIGSNVPLQVPGTNWSAVTAGGSSLSYFDTSNNPHVGGHTVALKSDGTLWAWGQNIFGQLGDGTYINMGYAGSGDHPLRGFVTFDVLLPLKIGTDTDWASISAGAGHTVALKNDGTLWAWGLNVNGQLANGNAGMNNMLPLPVGADRLLPYILPKHPWSSISAGGYQTFALRSDGTLWAWGWNGAGQLGDGTTVSTGGGSDANKASWKLPKYAYVVSDKIYSYTVDYTGSGQITSTGLAPAAAGTAPVAAAVDPAGSYLYAIDSAVSTVDGEKVSYIHSYAVARASGKLTEIGGPTGVATLYSPTSITVDPLGRFVYVVGTHSKGWKAIAVYAVNPATGELTCIGTTAQGAKLMTIEPQGRFVYVLKDAGIAAYDIDQRTGMLTRVATTANTTCNYDLCDDNEDNVDVYMAGAKYLNVDLSGQYLLVGATNVSVTSCTIFGVCSAATLPEAVKSYSINQTSGMVYDTGFAQGIAGLSSPMVIVPGEGTDSHTQYLYTITSSTELYGWPFNQLTGQPHGVSKEGATGALGLAGDPTGLSLYVFTAHNVFGTAIDPGSGKTQSFGAINNPIPMASDAGAGGVLKAVVLASY